MTLIIDFICGNCPVQAEGTINGVPFYFRARGQMWSLGVGADPVGSPDWESDANWGDNEYAAGWMTDEEAEAIIRRVAASYAAGEGPSRTFVRVAPKQTPTDGLPLFDGGNT